MSIVKFSERMNNHWVEKYRPKSIDDMILEEPIKNKMKKYIEEKQIPHLLFYGDPGSGKTTLSKILIKNIVSSKMDVLWLNGSEQRGIDVVRDTIIPYISTPPDMIDVIKIVFIDEFDYGTDALFAAMRETIEKQSIYCRFIATCNYINKIPDAIQSRFNCICLKPINDSDILTCINNILKNENIKYDEEYVKKIINRYKPDMRHIIHALNNSVVDNEIRSEAIELHDKKEDTILALIKQMLILKKNGRNDMIFNTMKVLKETIKLDGELIDYLKIYKILYFDNPDLINLNMEFVIANHVIQHNTAPFKTMNFLDCINLMVYQC